MPHGPTCDTRGTALATLELKKYIELLSCNVAQTSRYHWKGRNDAFLHAYEFIERVFIT
jgi:hypothetical protein